MTNLLQMQDTLKNLSDDVIKAQLQKPTGQVPSFLLAAELARRDAMRTESKTPPSKTVSDDLTSPVPAPSSLPPQMMAGAPAPPPLAMGAPPPAMGAPPPAMGARPQMMAGAPAAPPQGIAQFRKGGAVRMYDGGEPPAATEPLAPEGVDTGWFGSGSAYQAHRTQLARDYDAAAQDMAGPPTQDMAGAPVFASQGESRLPDAGPASSLPLPPRNPLDIPARARAAVAAPARVPPGGPSATPTPLDEIRTATRATQDAYAHALRETKPDSEARAKARTTNFLLDFGLRMLANKGSSKGLGGLGYAIGEAGTPALATMNADEVAARGDQRAYGKDWLEGEKLRLDSLVQAGRISATEAGNQLQYAATMGAAGIHAGAAAATNAENRAMRLHLGNQQAEGKLQWEYGRQLQAINTAAEKARENAVNDPAKVEVENKRLKAVQSLDLRYAGRPGFPPLPTPPPGAQVRDDM